MSSLQNGRDIKLFSIRHPFKSIGALIIICIFFILTVFGTYGTMRGGTEVTGESYLKYSFLATLCFFLGLLIFSVTIRKRLALRTYALRSLVGKLFFLFFFLSLFPLLIHPEKAFGTIAAAIGALMTLFLITNLVSNSKSFQGVVIILALYIWLTAVFAFATGAYSFYIQPLSLGPIYIEYNKNFWRVNSWFITSTAFGNFQALAFIAALYLFGTNNSTFRKIIILVSLSIFLFGMSLSGARTPFLGLVIGLSVLVLARLKITITVYKKFFSLIFVVLVGITFLKKYGEKVYVLRRLFGDASNTGSLGGRTNIVIESVGKMLDLSIFQVVFGSGLGTYQDVMKSSISAHSGMLRILIENGLLGFIIFIVLFAYLIYNTFRLVRSQQRSTNEDKFLLMLLVFFFSIEITTQNLMGISMETLIFYVIVGLVIANRRINRMRNYRVSRL